MDSWRIVTSAPAEGAMNMAVDEAILLQHAQGQAPPTLRLYAWQPAAISAGYFQRVRQDINLDACQRDGITVVRRLTGGRAVLHDDEVTYSLIVSEEYYPGAGILAAYRQLCEGLIEGLRRLGLDARLAPGKRAVHGPTGANCFAAAAQCDLVVGDRKICGSAQVRRNGVILQHGALLLSLTDPTPYWREPGAPANATDLTRELGYRPDRETVTAALAEGFATALGIALAPQPLTAAEQALAERLRAEKYATDAWNLRR